MISDEEIKTMFDKIVPKGIPSRSNPAFALLFKAYNERNAVKMQMNCMSCYTKVYFYFKNHFNKKPIPTKLVTINVINLSVDQPVDIYASAEQQQQIKRWREERVLSIAEQSKKFGFAVRFWPGNYDEKTFRCGNISRAFKQIVRWAKEKKLPTVTIAEDDMRFTSSGAWKYYLDNMPGDFDIYSGGIYAGQLFENRIVNGYSGNTLITIHEKFYDFFLSANEKDHLDRWLGNTAFENKYIVCLPFVVKQIGGYSENTKANKPLTAYEQSWTYYAG